MSSTVTSFCRSTKRLSPRLRARHAPERVRAPARHRLLRCGAAERRRDAAAARSREAGRVPVGERSGKTEARRSPRLPATIGSGDDCGSNAASASS